MDNPFPFLPNQFIIGNPASPIAVCCGWTPREAMKRKLEELGVTMDQICCIGQLYTAERGIDMMVRNLLAVPSIRWVCLTGQDRTKAQTAFYRFMKSIDDPYQEQNFWKTKDTNLRIGTDIPLEDLEALRKRVSVIDFEPENAAAEIRVLLEIEASARHEQVEPKIFTPIREEPQDYSGPDNGHVIRGKTVADVYVKILYNIMTFGARIHTHYDQDSKELMNLVAVITEQPPFNFDLPPFVPFSKEHLEAYRDKLLSPTKDPNVTYTYGNRMRLHFGADQIKEVVDKIAKEPITRSAVISLWDPCKEGSGSPCLNHLWFRVRNGALHMTATIRSNDMFYGWPENAYGLRYLQEYVRQTLMNVLGSFNDDGSLVLGDLVINSQSAHLYEDSWAPAQETVDAHYKYEEWWDEKGQWTFDYDGEKFTHVAELFKGEEFVTRITGTPGHIRREIARRNLVSDIGHAMYIGSILGRFEARGR